MKRRIKSIESLYQSHLHLKLVWTWCLFTLIVSANGTCNRCNKRNPNGRQKKRFFFFYFIELIRSYTKHSKCFLSFYEYFRLSYLSFRFWIVQCIQQCSEYHFALCAETLRIANICTFASFNPIPLELVYVLQSCTGRKREVACGREVVRRCMIIIHVSISIKC